jgi:BirA family transcriptional regulator, biotin operon repressor / biotin---[acetyl-CoA-carboxylase] ligase
VQQERMTRLITDDLATARLLAGAALVAEPDTTGDAAPAGGLVRAIFGDAPLLSLSVDQGSWRALLVRDFAPCSQFDTLIEHVRSGGAVGDRVAILARHGSGFHGADGRSWSALSGNIHLTALLAPGRDIPHFDTVFTALGAVACADAIDAVLRQGRARIKWVNDVVVDGRKLGGVLAWTEVQGTTVRTAVMGIGLNVECTPMIARAPDVPATGSLADHHSDIRVADVVSVLLSALERNYDALLRHGWEHIIDAYRARSAVVGRHVAVRSRGGTSEIARGRVERIGDSLELYLEGTHEPVRSGRLVLAREPS